jgi:hypothetical protein
MVAIPAIVKFGVALKTAMGPIGWAGLAITAIVGIVGGLATQLGEATNEFDSLTATSRAHHEEAQRARGDYERAISIYGENSAQVRRLREEMESTQLTFEQNLRTFAESRAETERVTAAGRALTEDFRARSNAITEHGERMSSTLERYKELRNMGARTADQDAEKAAAMKALVEEYGWTGLAVDAYTGSLNRSEEAVERLIGLQEEAERMRAYPNNLLAARISEQNEYAALAQAYENYNTARRAQDDREREANTSAGTAVWLSWRLFGGDIRREYAANRDRLNDARAQLDETRNDIAYIETFLANYDNALVEKQGGFVAVERVIYDSVIPAIGSLIEAYEEAQDAALESIRSQFSLWEEAPDVVEKSVSQMIEAQRSQLTYWQSYDENLKTIIADFSHLEGFHDIFGGAFDGSESAVALAAALAGECESVMKNFIEIRTAVMEAEQDTSHSAAELNAGLKYHMREIFGTMRETVEGMELSDEARSAAQETMRAYVAGIRESEREVRAAGQRVSGVLGRSLGGLQGFGIGGYASGTLSAPPGLAWVGEEGPELINFRGGERVYSTPESIRIITDSPPIDTSDIRFPDFPAPTQISHIGGNRTVKLEITGHGEIEVTSNTDPEAVWAFVEPKLKPTFIDMLREEIFEEGDNSYEF